VILQAAWLKSGKKWKVPQQIVPLAVTGAIAIIAAYLLKIDWLGIIKNQITQSSSLRLFYTVSENAQPYFTDWWGSFGLIFLLAFAGSALYFYELFKANSNSKLKLHWLTLAAYVIFFLAFIFGRFSTSSKYSTVVGFFSATYLYWLISFVILLVALYLIAYYKEPNCLSGMENKWEWMLLIVWILITLLMARGAIRLIFATVPPIAIAAGVAVSKITDIAKSQQNKIKYAILLGLVLFSAFAKY
jgi:asparagine N-glycosylation enzyme membrane subunit Stt3